jgi:hypothetical protein
MMGGHQAGGSFKLAKKRVTGGGVVANSVSSNTITKPVIQNSTNSLLFDNNNQQHHQHLPATVGSYLSHHQQQQQQLQQQKNKPPYHLDPNSNLTLTNVSMSSLVPFQVHSTPKHNLVVRNLKCKWNNVNRDVVFILYDIYNKSKQLRHNMSSQALKEYDLLTDQIVQNYLLNQQSKQQQQKSGVSNPATTRSGYSPYSTVNTAASQQQQKFSTSSSSSNQSSTATHFDIDSNTG